MSRFSWAHEKAPGESPDAVESINLLTLAVPGAIGPGSRRMRRIPL
ncbi:hypothetical protein FM112_02195 [Gulosibacter sp. 10]|nr:hypothetical protein FM112_02195 [Gulosibacter sp. 10]